METKDHHQGVDGAGAVAIEAARRMANAEKLTEALDGIRNSNFAILKELRAGTKYRKQNPPRDSEISEGLGDCEKCGTSRATFDDLVHHQMTAHPETFTPPDTLAFDAPPCLCSSCSPGAFGEWLREQPPPGPIPKKRLGPPATARG